MHELPDKIFDNELGWIEVLKPGLSKEDIERIEKETQKKIDFVEGREVA